MKPPFSYYGGKIRLARRIVDLIPEHRVYIEPFFGSGAVFFAKEPSKFEVINDLDDQVVNFFRVLRDQPDELARVCALTPYSRVEYLACRDNLDEDGIGEVEKARRFFVSVRQGFSGSTSGNVGWSLSVKSNAPTPDRFVNSVSAFAELAGRLRTVAIENCDAADLIARRATTEDTVVYADPPYLAETRAGANNYRVDTAAEEDHRRLAEALNATPAKVILSGYASPLYEELYGDWHRIDIEVTAFAHHANRNPRTEVLWLNYDPEPQEDEPEPKAADQPILFG